MAVLVGMEGVLLCITILKQEKELRKYNIVIE